MKESWSQYSDSIEKSREYHKRYQIAVNNPIRRQILKLLLKGKKLNTIKHELNLSDSQLEYHLKILEWGFCIERKGEDIKVTKEGMVVNFLE